MIPPSSPSLDGLDSADPRQYPIFEYACQEGNYALTDDGSASGRLFLVCRSRL
jgi:hypothetical protein